MTANLTIGELAEQSGVPAKTIRYYEQIELVAPPKRSTSGYRLYAPRDVQVLRFIKRARDLGFGIKEVSELLALWLDDERASSEVKQLVGVQLERIDQKLRELRALRSTLQSLYQSCEGDERPNCPILKDLAAPDQGEE